MLSSKRFLRPVVVAALAHEWAVSPHAQTYQGGLRGLVKDTQGVIPGVEVTLVNDETNAGRAGEVELLHNGHEIVAVRAQAMHPYDARPRVRRRFYSDCFEGFVAHGDHCGVMPTVFTISPYFAASLRMRA